MFGVYFYVDVYLNQDFPVAQTVKNLPVMQETRVQSLGQEDPLENGIATHTIILAWRIPWTDKPGGLQFMGSLRVGPTEQLKHTHTHTYTHLCHFLYAFCVWLVVWLIYDLYYLPIFKAAF